MQVSKRNGLVASPFWVNDLGQRTSPYSPVKSEEIKADRSELMRFVREATDHKFKFEQESGSFHMQDWNLVAGFANEALRNWDNHFKLEFEDVKSISNVLNISFNETEELLKEQIKKHNE